MSEVKEIKVVIAGTKPLLMHRFTDEAQLKATAGTSSSIANDRSPAHAQAEAALYTDEKGTIGIPQPNILRCIIDGGKFHKVGRTKVTTQKSSLVSAAVDIDPLFVPLKHEAPWRVDTRPVRIPATGGRILRHRPCFEDWSLKFTISLDTSILSVDLLRQIVNSSGRMIGLGDFRPDTKGPFGRFEVNEWKVK